MPDTADGQLGRIADRFALVAMGGELATEWGLTGWRPGWATEAAACFYGMVGMRPGGFGSGEEAAMLPQARTYFTEHGEDRFSDWGRAESDDSHRPDTQQRAGWRKAAKDAVNGAVSTEWFVLFDAFVKQVWRRARPSSHAEDTAHPWAPGARQGPALRPFGPPAWHRQNSLLPHQVFHPGRHRR